MEIKDLNTVDRHTAGAEMQVNDENGKSLDMFITIAGADSKAWRKASIEMKRLLLAGFDPVDAMADAMAKISIGWRGVEMEGVKLEFSQESVRNLYTSAPYIADQVDSFMSKRANFTQSKEAS